MAAGSARRGHRDDRTDPGPGGSNAEPDRRRRREYRWRVNSLWAVPVLCIAAGCGIACVTLAVDGRLGYDAVPGHPLGTATAVQTILSTAASAMLTLTTVVLTVLTLGVQLAMQQFSPRIVRALLSDGRSQLAHGLFAATFLFCMVGVAAVHDTAGTGHQVPIVTVTVAYLLLLASLLVLVAYVHHAGQSLRVAGLVDLVGDNLQREIDRSFAQEVRPERTPGMLTADESGVVVMLDVDLLVDGARRSHECLEMLVAVGDFVPRGALLARRRGGHGDDDQALRRGILLDNERSHVGDAAYGLRKLTEVAQRSIASGPHDDPGTAVQAIDRIHDAVRQLSTRRMPATHHHDADGVLRLVTRELTWEGYVAVAFDELVPLSSSSRFVTRRLLAAFDDLIAVAPADRRPAIVQQRQRLVRDAEQHHVPLVPDRQGLGSGDDVSTPPVRVMPGQHDGADGAT
ncbi:DUF2254 family protein [Curtobacterium sp. A7_M15]|uniref:DUF2254 domain-containing protein n=1 Tax=Curtobacterium sp. A7_M15 TaxID=3065241 RepID=UPI002737EC1E|nr:DUF2254 family protein [Curtobacterium sp. A7_M15]MDP4334864.1 DUF2254 family protein [Curtobacterium sp. A7_M15]